MSAVVHRCPQCGSSQDLPGRCGSCHAADVRCYCANHTPGRWLDAATCAACGAHLHFDPFPPATPQRPSARRPATPPPLRPGPRVPRPADPAPAPPPRPSRPPRRSERAGGALPAWLDRPPGMAPRRRGRTRAAPADAGAGAAPAVRGPGSSFGGYVVRLVAVLGLLILLVLGAGVVFLARR